MEDKRLKLPIGIQSFEDIRTDGCVYVDKTEYLVDLIDNGKPYFLARPRRFGKSLTLSTFEALFSGRKELFKGLAAEEFLNRPGFQPNPVIRLDMSRVNTNEGTEGIKESILYLTRETARKLQVEVSDTKLYGILLSELISRVAEKHNQKVAVLVDEYDKPYTDFVNDPVMAREVRNVLRDYYVQLKANYEYIRFVFITGISKFARLGVFSTLNNIIDISMMPEYAEICGYTEEEIIQNFPDYLEETAARMKITVAELMDKMRYYYNGFSFDREAKARLYNPFSTLSFFMNKSFSNYWFQSGTSKFIADYMKDRNLTVEQFRDLPVSIDFLENPGDMDVTPPEGFLFQSGYLTLRKGTSNDLSLDYPNTEVLISMSQLLTQNILAENSNLAQNNLLIALMNRDTEKLIEVLNELLAGIPFDDFTRAAKQSISLSGSKMTAREWLYRSTILAFMRGCGVVVFAEAPSNLGQADLVVAHRGVTWVIEIKVAYEGENPETKAKQVLRHIETKNYAKSYPNAVSLALIIDDTTRQIILA
jgi:hypothetical protein